MPRRSAVIALVEDAHHEMLVYRYLCRERGMSRHDIRIKPSPIGRHSAEQWVRLNYPTEVKALRTRHAMTVLIVMIDADAYTVDQRLAQLATALEEVGSPPLRVNEPVARLVPKRNVETWVLCLNERPVNEEADYKGTRHDWNDLIPEASGSLFRLTRPNVPIPENCIDSLARAIRELRRLES
jgi:hypothetical protein